jgi:hypothetical protein
LKSTSNKFVKNYKFIEKSIIFEEIKKFTKAESIDSIVFDLSERSPVVFLFFSSLLLERIGPI